MSISETDHIMILRSKMVSQSSHDPHRQVGVVIVGNDEIVLATGSNSPPADLNCDVASSHQAISADSQWKYFMLEHAERNAIFTAVKQGKSLVGATLYGNLFPCADCARAIVAAGISRVVVPHPGASLDRDIKWQDHYRYALQIFELSRTRVDYFDSNGV